MITLIVACAKNRVIGKDGTIPWNIPGELAHFREATMGGALIMGRRTYEDIGRPLQGRLTIVISGSKTFEGENVVTVRSAEEAVRAAGGREIFVCGGRRVYEEMLPLSDRLIITEVDLEPPGDTFFPAFDENEFEPVSEKRFEGEVPYTIRVFERKHKA